MARRRLLALLALALVGGAVAWALAGLPGALAADGDCEAAGRGPIRQPANAWSSLALAGAGLALLLPNRPTPGTATAASLALVLAGTLAFTFHAGVTAWAARLDGIGVGALIAALAADAWWRGRRAAPAPGPADPGIESRRAGREWRRRGRALLPWALLGVGGLCWALGRSGGPWCRPDSLLQAHAAWHVLAAAGLTDRKSVV